MAKKRAATSQFLFTLPAVSSDLTEGAQAAIQMGALASRLVGTGRTRVIHPDGRAENVAEHSLMLAKVAPELGELLYPELDANLVARFAGLHDDVEAYVGDTPTDMMAEHDPAAKEILEQKGLQQLRTDFMHLPGYVRLIEQYEAGNVPEVRFVRAADKLMVLLVHIPNEAAVLRTHYTYESFLDSERRQLERDDYKYGEFDKIRELRRELGQELADRYLKDIISLGT